LDKMLTKLHQQGHRVLIFSQVCVCGAHEGVLFQMMIV
jgi:hypothetical protein